MKHSIHKRSMFDLMFESENPIQERTRTRNLLHRNTLSDLLFEEKDWTKEIGKVYKHKNNLYAQIKSGDLDDDGKLRGYLVHTGGSFWFDEVKKINPEDLEGDPLEKDEIREKNRDLQMDFVSPSGGGASEETVGEAPAVEPEETIEDPDGEGTITVTEQDPETGDVEGENEEGEQVTVAADEVEEAEGAPAGDEAAERMEKWKASIPPNASIAFPEEWGVPEGIKVDSAMYDKAAGTIGYKKYDGSESFEEWLVGYGKAGTEINAKLEQEMKARDLQIEIPPLEPNESPPLTSGVEDAVGDLPNELDDEQKEDLQQAIDVIEDPDAKEDAIEDAAEEIETVAEEEPGDAEEKDPDVLERKAKFEAGEMKFKNGDKAKPDILNKYAVGLDLPKYDGTQSVDDWYQSIIEEDEAQIDRLLAQLGQRDVEVEEPQPASPDKPPEDPVPPAPAEIVDAIEELPDELSPEQQTDVQQQIATIDDAENVSDADRLRDALMDVPDPDDQEEAAGPAPTVQPNDTIANPAGDGTLNVTEQDPESGDVTAENEEGNRVEVPSADVEQVEETPEEGVSFEEIAKKVKDPDKTIQALVKTDAIPKDAPKEFIAAILGVADISEEQYTALMEGNVPKSKSADLDRWLLLAGVK